MHLSNLFSAWVLVLRAKTPHLWHVDSPWTQAFPHSLFVASITPPCFRWPFRLRPPAEGKTEGPAPQGQGSKGIESWERRIPSSRWLEGGGGASRRGAQKSKVVAGAAQSSRQHCLGRKLYIDDSTFLSPTLVSPHATLCLGKHLLCLLELPLSQVTLVLESGNST